MPFYEHCCKNPDCNYEWEDEYSIKDDPPECCPKCGQKTAQRLISLGGKGIVELTGRDLVDKIKADAKALKKEAARDAKVYSNLMGETKYHDLQTKMDRRRRK
jgi:putative FmdB family regulatory protein